MKNFATKKLLTLFLLLLFVLSLSSCGSSEDLSSQAANRNFSHDFDTATNRTIAFEGILFQIPREWTVTETTDVLLEITGKNESHAGHMSVELLDSGVTEEELSTKDCQMAILKAYVQIFQESFDNVKTTNHNYDKQNQLYSITIEASANDAFYEFKIYAFVEQENLYAYFLPYMAEDKYDYSADVQEAIKSVVAFNQNSETFNFSMVPSVTYDSISAATYQEEIISTEAFIRTCNYDASLEKYVLTLLYWSDKQDKYVQKENCYISTDAISPKFLESLESFDAGDKIRAAVIIHEDNSFEYIWLELLEKGTLSDLGIASSPTQNKESTEDNNHSNADITDISVSFKTNYVDGDRLHIKVFTKNSSSEIFSGNLYVTFYSADGKDVLGSDTILVEELNPGLESWANITVDSYKGTPKMTVDFSDVSFVSVEKSTTEIDKEATKEVKESYYYNFDGVSWYNDITDIVVYIDGTCIVTVKDKTKEDSQFYASVIWGCGEDYGVETAQVVDSDGNILAVY